MQRRLWQCQQQEQWFVTALLPVVVGRDGVGNPSGVGIGVNDANGWDVVQGAFVEQDIVFQWVQAHDKIRAKGGPVVELLVKALDLLIQLVDDLCLAPAEDLLAVCDATRDPALEQMIALGQLGGPGNGPVLAITGSHKQYHASPAGDFLDNLCGSTQMGGGDFKRDDVDALPDAVYVAGICGVPERRDMTLMGFGGEQQLEGDVGRRGRVVEQRVWAVVRGNVGSQLSQHLGWSMLC